MGRNDDSDDRDDKREVKEVLPADKWFKAKIAYNNEGNIVILDPTVARIIRLGAREDREVDIGLSPIPVIIEPTPEEIRKGPLIIRPQNAMCACGKLHLHLIKEQPMHTDPLSDRARTDGM